jgi:carboxymethylenebutenolidase
MSDTTTVSTSDGPMIIHWAQPRTAAAPHSLPGILVFQEAFGVNRHVLGVCQRLADAGYVAAAPELFHREGSGVIFGYDDFAKVKPVISRMTNATLLTDIRAAHEALAQNPLVNPKRIFSIGFCLGGFVSVLAALNLPLAAAVSFYGGGVVKGRPGFGLSPLIDEFDRLACPTLHVFGEKDASISAEDIALLRSRLEALHKPHQIEVYPDAGHGFLCEDRSAYQPQAAAAAWALTLRWLQ